jgi:oligopeptide/dipeptide ABC transporter ATP-binding protein
MYLGRLVELASEEALYNTPRHPYTEALLSAAPTPNPEVRRQRIVLQGDVPNPMNPPSGCMFHPRCRRAGELCTREAPVWREVGPQHYVACHLA